VCKRVGVVSLRRRLLAGFALLITVAASASCSDKTIIKKSGPGANGETETTGRRESVPCKSGAVTAPVEAWDITPDDSVGKVCDFGNILDDDGNVAGLDRLNEGTHKVAGRDVNGCVAVEFGDNITIQSLIVKMRPVGAGCGHACTPGKDGCGTGWKVALFVGETYEKLEFLQQLSLTTADMFEYRVAVHESYKARFGVVCREPTPTGGDDIAIDSIAGLCN
jgi:hypothetical protein